MAWGKSFTLKVGNTTDALDVSALDVDFKVHRSVIFNECKAEFTIWNPSTATEAQFMQPKTSQVECIAGYADEGTGVIFKGHILDAHPEWDGPDRKLTLLARPLRSSGYNQSFANGVSLDYIIADATTTVKTGTYLNLSYARDTLLSTILQDVSTIIEVPITGLSAITWKLPGGYVASGSLQLVLKDLERFLQQHGYNMFMDLTQWVIYTWNAKKFNSALVIQQVAALDKDSGLLGVSPARIYTWDPKQLEVAPPAKTWEVHAILNPAFQPNALIDIDSKGFDVANPLKGLYLIESVEFFGNNREGQFDATIIISEQPNK